MIQKLNRGTIMTFKQQISAKYIIAADETPLVWTKKIENIHGMIERHTWEAKLGGIEFHYTVHGGNLHWIFQGKENMMTIKFEKVKDEIERVRYDLLKAKKMKDVNLILLHIKKK